MKTRWLGLSFAVVSVLAVGAAWSGADDDHHHQDRRLFRAEMSPFNEVPAISTTATGTFAARLSADGTTLAFRLTYADTEGDPSAAHIHFAQAGVNGGVMAFLCGGGTKPACPPAPGVVMGTIVAADIVGPAAQGVVAGDFAAFVRALRAGRTYANAHNAKFPGGTLRGQIRRASH